MPPADVHIMGQAIGSGDWRRLVYNHPKLGIALFVLPKNLQREWVRFQGVSPVSPACCYGSPERMEPEQRQVILASKNNLCH